MLIKIKDLGEYRRGEPMELEINTDYIRSIVPTEHDHSTYIVDTASGQHLISERDKNRIDGVVIQHGIGRADELTTIHFLIKKIDLSLVRMGHLYTGLVVILGALFMLFKIIDWIIS